MSKVVDADDGFDWGLRRMGSILIGYLRACLLAGQTAGPSDVKRADGWAD